MKINRCLLENDIYLLKDSVKDIFDIFDVNLIIEDIFDRKELPPMSMLISYNVSIEKYKIILRTTFLYRKNFAVQEKYLTKSELFEPSNPNKTIKQLMKISVFEFLRDITGRIPSPWGILRGVRPSKIVHSLLDQNCSPAKIVNVLEEKYAVQSDKANLILEIALRQRGIIPFESKKQQEVDVYVGIPYCPSRCLYCSFPSYVLPGSGQVNDFLSVLEEDIKAVAQLIDNYQLSVQNVYLGGGTPTSLCTEDFSRLLGMVEKYIISKTTLKEFTVEAGRPDTITDGKIHLMKYYGVNRVSINPQSMQEKTLKVIGRMHTVQDIINTLGKIRTCFNPVINMDMIVGLPGEDAADVEDTVKRIVELEPENITLHTLSVKRGSILKNLYLQDDIDILPSADVVEHMYNVAVSVISANNYVPYYLYRQKNIKANMENVGYSKPRCECLYNIDIIEERKTIIGIGPAACTKAVNVSDWSLRSCYNPKDIATYIGSYQKYIDRRKNLLRDLFSAKGDL